MKKIKNVIILVAVFSFGSCENYLDLSPELGLTDEVVFDNFESTRGYLDRCFNLVNDFTHWNAQRNRRAHVATMSDEAGQTFEFNPIFSVINSGQWYRQPGSAEVGYDNSHVGDVLGNVIPSAFNGLRVTNTIIEKVPGSSLTQAQKDQLLGQAYFFRSWFYFEIIRRWGGMPIFDRAFTPDSQMDLERENYHVSTEWLIKGLDKAVALLPVEWPEAEKGRPDRVAAMALKSMAALYAASPLMRNDVNSLNQYTEYDMEWSRDAAKYAHDVIQFIDTQVPGRKLVGEGLTGYERDSAYISIFRHRPNYVSHEALWFLNHTNRDFDVNLSIFFQNSRWSSRPGNYGWAVSTPTQNLVDMFEVINPNDGRSYPIDHPNSGYSMDNPYANRDPRFYLSILPPGHSYGLDPAGRPCYLETWEGGQDYSSNWTRSVPTGYFFIRYIPPEAKGWNKPGYNLYNHSCNHIRITQIYLDYAEAMNEAYGPNADPQGFGMTAVQAINRIRARAGVPPVLNELTGSKEVFRDRIRNERGVELAYENHRWFDIRRWMIAEDLFNLPGDPYPIKGMQVRDLTPGEPDISKKSFEYTVVPVPTQTRVFERRHYWYPVAADHTDQLGNLRQNPGW